MKKIYLIPALQVEEAQAAQAQMLVESLSIVSDETVSGDEALTKEDDSWDAWDEE